MTVTVLNFQQIMKVVEKYQTHFVGQTRDETQHERGFNFTLNMQEQLNFEESLYKQKTNFAT